MTDSMTISDSDFGYRRTTGIQHQSKSPKLMISRHVSDAPKSRASKKIRRSRLNCCVPKVDRDKDIAKSLSPQPRRGTHHQHDDRKDLR